MSFHVFSLCEHAEQGSVDLVGVSTANIDGAPSQLVDVLQAHPLQPLRGRNFNDQVRGTSGTLAVTT